MAIIDTRQPGGGFGVLIETLLNKERLEQQEQAQKLQERQFNLRQEESVRQREMQQAAMQGAQAAAAFLSGQGGIPGLEEAAADVPQASLPAFMETMNAFLQGQGQARQAVAGADVAEETVEPTIATAEAGAREAGARARGAEVGARIAEETEDVQVAQARANLTDANLRNKLMSETLRADPERGGLALRAWIESEGQMTWREAKEAAGVTAEDSINPELRFQGATGTRGGEQAAQARSFLPLMMETHQNINSLHEQGVRLSLPGAIQKGTRIPSIDALLNIASTPEQRQLIQSQRAFADFYRFSLSGQQSSDAERLAMMLSITEQVGDDESTIAQKRRLRDTMIAATRARAGGTMSPLEAAQAGLRMATPLGVEEITDAYQGLIDDVIEDMQGEPSDVPGTGGGIGGVEGVVDGVIGGNR